MTPKDFLSALKRVLDEAASTKSVENVDSVNISIWACISRVVFISVHRTLTPGVMGADKASRWSQSCWPVAVKRFLNLLDSWSASNLIARYPIEWNFMVFVMLFCHFVCQKFFNFPFRTFCLHYRTFPFCLKAPTSNEAHHFVFVFHFLSCLNFLSPGYWEVTLGGPSIYLLFM